jgi:hypothetical protein
MLKPLLPLACLLVVTSCAPADNPGSPGAQPGPASGSGGGTGAKGGTVASGGTSGGSAGGMAGSPAATGGALGNPAPAGDTGGSSGATGGAAGASDAAGAPADSGEPPADTGAGPSEPVPPGLHSIFDGKTLDGWFPGAKDPADPTKISESPMLWSVVDGALHSNGTSRGFLATKADYGDFRLIFSIRHLPATGKNHQPCIVIWGRRPFPNDAGGGIQIQAPHTSMWDYRPGHDGNLGGQAVGKAAINDSQWAQCEVLAKAIAGEFRMACCQRTGADRCKGVELLKFAKPGYGNVGPIMLQVHNPGLHDEYKDISIEANPTVDDLITTK